LEGRKLDFGVSGDLYNSNLLMYDHQTGSEWLQLTGTAIEGPLTGRKLRVYPVAYDEWASWRRNHPDGLVLAIPEDFAARFGSYDDSPYAGYDDSPRLWFHVSALDRRLPRKARVVGVEVRGGYKAYPEATVWKTAVIDDRVGGTHVSILADRGRSHIGAFATEHRFLFAGSTVVDESGHEWRWISDTLRDGSTVIISVPVVQTFWFAWFAMHPKTELGTT
jgi:hypothetical protein